MRFRRIVPGFAPDAGAEFDGADPHRGLAFRAPFKPMAARPGAEADHAIMVTGAAPR